MNKTRVFYQDEVRRLQGKIHLLRVRLGSERAIFNNGTTLCILDHELVRLVHELAEAKKILKRYAKG